MGQINVFVYAIVVTVCADVREAVLIVHHEAIRPPHAFGTDICHPVQSPDGRTVLQVEVGHRVCSVSTSLHHCQVSAGVQEKIIHAQQW